MLSLKNFSLVFLLTSAMVPSILFPPGSLAGGCGCPPLWTAFGQHCYRLFTVRNITWFDAEKFCRGFSVPCGDGGSSGISLGHLTSVHSQEEMDLLGTLYDSVRSKWSPSPTWVWIGLHDKTTEDTFEWSDGSTVNYSHWNAGQPDVGEGQDCIMFRNLYEFKWHDTSCDWRHPESFICKLPAW